MHFPEVHLLKYLDLGEVNRIFCRSHRVYGLVRLLFTAKIDLKSTFFFNQQIIKSISFLSHIYFRKHVLFIYIFFFYLFFIF